MKAPARPCCRARRRCAAFAGDRMALGLARMEAHYFINDIFLPEERPARRIPKIRKIPAFIVQGRYDLVCPIRTRRRAAPRLAGGHLSGGPDAGHSAMEPGIRAALVRHGAVQGRRSPELRGRTGRGGKGTWFPLMSRDPRRARPRSRACVFT